MAYIWQFYSFLAAVFLQVGFLAKHKKKLVAGLLFLEFLFLSGFRSVAIGNDTQSYVAFFAMAVRHISLDNTHMEIGFRGYNHLIAFFTQNPQVFLFIIAFIILSVWLYTLYKYSVSFGLATMLFAILEFSVTLTMLRQEMAMCLVMLSIPFIIKRQFLPFMALVAAAMSFHDTAILAMGLFWVYKLPFKSRYVLMFLAGTAVCAIFLPPIIEKIIAITGKYESYVGNILLGEETKIASLFKTLISLVIVLFCYVSYIITSPRWKEIPSLLPAPFLLWGCLIHFGLMVTSIQATVMERLAAYFSCFQYCALAFFVCCYPKKSRFLVACILLGCFVVYQSIVFVYRPEWNYVLPFKFCF